MNLDIIQIGDVFEFPCSDYHFKIKKINDDNFEIISNVPYSKDPDFYISDDIKKEKILKSWLKILIIVKRGTEIIFTNEDNTSTYNKYSIENIKGMHHVPIY